MKKLLIQTSVLVILTGCAHFSSRQTKTDKDGTIITSHQSVTTLFDAKSDIAKLRASTTDKTQGLTVGSLNEETSGTNVTSLTEGIVSAAVSAAVKSTVKP